MSNHNASHVKTLIRVGLNQAENIHVIGNSEIGTDFVFLNVCRVDGDDDFSLICKLKKHAQLTVRCKAREHP